jgi:hypothetical protein
MLIRGDYQRLIIKASVSVRWTSGLFTHIKHGDAKKVHSFLSHIATKGPNALKLAVNSRDSSGFTPLMLAASNCYGQQRDAIERKKILHTLLKTPVDGTLALTL